ncbi:MAG: hypothetical protein ACXVJD_04740 [Mucilaginibacter sp.]
MYQLYRIGEDSLPAAAGRTIRSAIKVMAIVYLLLIVYMVWRFQAGFKDVLIGAAVCVPGYGLALAISYPLLKQRYRTFRIFLDDDGVGFHIRGNDKKISWNNLRKITKADDTIELRDEHISAAFRVLTGEGSILLIPEIEHFDELLAEIDKFKTSS